MPRICRHLLLCTLLALPLATATMWSTGAARSEVITIATWNLEWLVAAETAHAGRRACRTAQRAALPCDVVQNLARDSADLRRLAAYARALDADVIAFQEVENAAIARQVFRGYRICMTGGAGVQHVGFAVRPHVAHRCGPVVAALSLNGRARSGMSLQLAPASSAAVELLVVHLKSGCSREPLDAGSAACRILEQQSRQLGQWIAARAAPGGRFIVLGDLNRVPAAPAADRFWEQLQASEFATIASQLPFRNCYLGQPYLQFIDHILIGKALLPALVPGSARRYGYRSPDVVRYRLSDHCPVRVSLRLAAVI